MRFSILTIALNAEKYIGETLKSSSDQTFRDFEHLVWDGGSRDGTVDVVTQFAHAQLVQGRDRGISDAMNKIAAHARGEYLLFLHADDQLAHPCVLDKVNTALAQHPGVEWLYGQVEKIDEEGQKSGLLPFRSFSKGLLLKYNMIAHPGVFIFRSLFEREGGYRTDLKYAMDYELWLRLSQHHTPFALATPVAAFRAHPGSLSTTRPLAVANEAYEVRNRYTSTLYQRWRSYRTWKSRIKSLML